MTKIKRALIPGSFDPITLGHCDMIKRAAGLFDEVIVAVFENSDKRSLFSATQRANFARIALSELVNVRVDLSHGLLARYFLDEGCDVMLKGVRSAADYDYEFWLSLINRSLDAKIETLFIPSRAENQHISSTVVREMLKYGQDLSPFMPQSIIPAVTESYKALRPNV